MASFDRDEGQTSKNIRAPAPSGQSGLHHTHHRHSGATRKRRARNPFCRSARGRMDSGPAPESASRNDRVWQLEALAQTPPKLGLICGLWNTGVAHARAQLCRLPWLFPQSRYQSVPARSDCLKISKQHGACCDPSGISDLPSKWHCFREASLPIQVLPVLRSYPGAVLSRPSISFVHIRCCQRETAAEQ
jgi:hypothetical protein